MVGVWFGFRREGVFPFIKKKKRCQKFFYYIKKQKKIFGALRAPGGSQFFRPSRGGIPTTPSRFFRGGGYLTFRFLEGGYHDEPPPIADVWHRPGQTRRDLIKRTLLDPLRSFLTILSTFWSQKWTNLGPF